MKYRWLYLIYIKTLNTCYNIPMRKLLVVLAIFILLFSGYMYLMVGVFSGLGTCREGSVTCFEYNNNINTYRWASILMMVSSLIGIVGMMRNTDVSDDRQLFPAFAFIGIVIPIFIYIVLGQLVGPV